MVRAAAPSRTAQSSADGEEGTEENGVHRAQHGIGGERHRVSELRTVEKRDVTLQRDCRSHDAAKRRAESRRSPTNTTASQVRWPLRLSAVGCSPPRPAPPVGRATVSGSVPWLCVSPA